MVIQLIPLFINRISTAGRLFPTIVLNCSISNVTRNFIWARLKSNITDIDNNKLFCYCQKHIGVKLTLHITYKSTYFK